MKLTALINNDIKAAMLAKDKEKLEAVRAAKSAFMLAIAAKSAGSELTDEEEIAILKKLVKQRLDAAEIYVQQNRMDLAEPEQFQAAIIKAYLPQEMPVEELTAIIKEIIAQCGATSAKEMGKVMGIASKQLQGKADNKTISEVIKNLLTD
jgi:uncharacterized protein